MVTRMPPSWHSCTASIASLRGGSSRPIRPSRTRFLGRSAGPRLPAFTSGSSSHASASTRSPWPASRSAVCMKRSRSSGTASPDAVCWRSQCAMMTSGAPLTNRISLPSARRCSVAMNLCSDSNGMASMRGRDCGLRLAVHAELGRERVERALGRIALDLPDAVRLEELGVVAEHRDAADQLEHRVLARGLAVLLDLALGRVAVAADLVLGLGRGGRHDHHLHQGQGAGLVGADARHRTQGLHRRQAPDDRVAARHALHADGQRDRDERRQAFRDQRHRDADDGLEQLDEDPCPSPSGRRRTPATLTTPTTAVIR